MKFGDIIGQGILKTQLQNDILNSRLSHAYMFSGSNGMGKDFISEVLIQAIMCQNKLSDGSGCGECPSCKKVLSHNHPDIKRLSEDSSKNIKVEAVRTFFSDVRIKPFAADRKIYLIKEAHKMNEAAQNSALKIIEEPPEYTNIILLVEDTDKILSTIKSRCKIIKLFPYSEKEIGEILNSNADARDIGAEKLKFFIKYSDGVPGVAKRLQGSEDFDTLRESAFKVVKEIISTSSYGRILQFAEFFSGNSDNKEQIIDMVLYIFMDILKYKKAGEEFIMNLDRVPEIKIFAKDLNYDRLLRIIKALLNTKKIMGYNINYNLAAERMVIDMI